MRFAALRHIFSTLAVIASFATFTPHAGGTAVGVSSAPVLEARIVAHVNLVRRRHGLEPLSVSPSLAKAARIHSRDMAARRYLAHSSATGIPFWKRIERHYVSRGYDRWEVGENIICREAGISAAEIVQRWMGSPTHRANLLSPIWRELGAGAVRAPAFGRRAVTIVTLDLGIRS